MLALFSKTFARGIHPPGHKDTAAVPVRRMGFADRLIVPLSQHVGRPAKVAVRVGQEVVRGEPLAEADGFLSVPHHAPATGVVEAIRLHPAAHGQWTPSVVLRVWQADPQAVQWSRPLDVSCLDRDGLALAIQATGVVGLGGGVFPSHAKLKVPEQYPVDTLVVNGCECEPYLTSDHRVMVERGRELMAGIALARRMLGQPRAIIGIEDNKPEALQTLTPLLPADGSVTLRAVPTRYPQGAGEMLVKTLLQREVPPDARIYTTGAYVQNVATLAHIGALTERGEGFIERIITVAGTALSRPGNYLVPLGTPLRHVLAQAGVESGGKAGAVEVVLGGPMMGEAVADLDTPVTKGVAGILVFRARDLVERAGRGGQVYPCIKCGACVAACPMGLNPSTLGMLAAKREYQTMADDYRLGACFECGCCAYSCPSHIPLVQQFKVAKAVLRGRQKS